MSRVQSLLSVVSLICLFALGCGDTKKTALVKGRVTYKGLPVTSGTITFVPEGNAPSATGNLSPDGTYELTTYKPNDGAVLGKHSVMIVAIDTQVTRLPEDRSPLPPPIIPTKYLDNNTSGLIAEVADKENVIDFELTGELPGKNKK